MNEDERLIRLGGVAGLLGTLLYFAVAVADPFLWPETRTTQDFLTLMGGAQHSVLNKAERLVFLAALFLWLVSFLGLERLLSREKPSLAARLGSLFGIIACAIMVGMTIVQGTVMIKMGQAFVAAGDETQRHAVVELYRGLRYVDYGLDLAFDSFFFSAWILLGYAMLRHGSFGKVLGAIGILLFAVDGPLQIWYAPDPPPVELGPLGALWLLAVYGQTLRAVKRISHSV